MLGIPYLTLLAAMSIYVRTVGCITKYGCYGSSHLSCSRHTLTCGDGEVIGIDDSLNPVSVLDNIQLPGCDAEVEGDSCRKSCCGQAGLAHKCPRNMHQPLTNQSVYDVADDPEINLDDFVIYVYKKCSLRRSCTVVPPFNSTNQTSSCIRYKFICIEESSVFNMVREFSVLKHNALMLYFTGKSRLKHISLNCSCKVQSSHDIRMASLYIHLRNNSGDQVKISMDNQLLFDSKYDVDVLYGQILEFSTYPFTIEFNNFVPSEEDVIWLEFLAVDNFLNATCSGCGVPVLSLKVPAFSSGQQQSPIPLNVLYILVMIYVMSRGC